MLIPIFLRLELQLILCQSPQEILNESINRYTRWPTVTSSEKKKKIETSQICSKEKDVGLENFFQMNNPTASTLQSVAKIRATEK